MTLVSSYFAVVIEPRSRYTYNSNQAMTLDGRSGVSSEPIQVRNTSKNQSGDATESIPGTRVHLGSTTVLCRIVIDYQRTWLRVIIPHRSSGWLEDLMSWRMRKQKPERMGLEIKISNIVDLGLFTTKAIAEGVVIGYYWGRYFFDRLESTSE